MRSVRSCDFGPPFVMTDAEAQALELLVGERRDRNPSVLGRKRIEALALRRLILVFVLGHESVADHRVVAGERHHRFDHRDADVLADAAIARRVQRAHDAERGGHPADLVGQRHLDHGRLSAAPPLQRRHGREALDDRVVGGRVGVTALGAEAADRAIDDLGIEPADIGVADAEAVGDAGAVVLDKRVGAHGQHPHQVAALFFLEVDHDAALVAVEIQERRGDAVLARPSDPPRGVALGRLDLDQRRRRGRPAASRKTAPRPPGSGRGCENQPTVLLPCEIFPQCVCPPRRHSIVAIPAPASSADFAGAGATPPFQDTSQSARARG